MTNNSQAYEAFSDQFALELDRISDEDLPTYIDELTRDLFSEARQANIAILGYRPDEEITTDGVKGRPPREMRRGGYTRIEFDLDSDILIFTLEVLRKLSPRSGLNWKTPDQTYIESHALFIDGQQVPGPRAVKGEWTHARYVNLRPYARKIHFGLSQQAPRGVYQTMAYPLVRRRYGRMYDVSFEWFSMPSFIVGETERLGQRQKRNTKASDQRLMRHPSLVIRQKG